MPGLPKQKLATILVVDDTALVINVVVTILKAARFVVLPARSGLDALRIATDYTEPIDLLLSDVNMPGMSGPALGEFLRKARPEMRLMFMSGYDYADFITQDGWSYIQKPFRGGKLVERIDSLLRISAPARPGRRGQPGGDSIAVPENEGPWLTSTLSARS